MDGKDCRDEPSAGHGQELHQSPQQQAIDNVQKHVDDVIAERIQAPKLVFQPEARVDNRPVVAFAPDVSRREPDLLQAGNASNGVLLGEDRVVPDEAAEDRGEVARYDESREDQCGCRVSATQVPRQCRWPVMPVRSRRLAVPSARGGSLTSGCRAGRCGLSIACPFRQLGPRHVFLSPATAPQRTFSRVRGSPRHSVAVMVLARLSTCPIRESAVSQLTGLMNQSAGWRSNLTERFRLLARRSSALQSFRVECMSGASLPLLRNGVDPPAAALEAGPCRAWTSQGLGGRGCARVTADTAATDARGGVGLAPYPGIGDAEPDLMGKTGRLVPGPRHRGTGPVCLR